MVAISLYRGDLHRVPATNIRRWPPPPSAFTLREFRSLLLKRARALARPPPPPPPKDEEGMGDSGVNPIEPVNVTAEPMEPAGTEADQATTIAAEVEAEGAGEPMVDAGTSAPQTATVAVEVEAEGVGDASAVAAEVKMEATDTSDIVGEKETRKTELEKKLQVLNDKKHHLVQMLKQILHTEEEIKRRSSMCIPTSGFRASIPIQPESAVEMGSVTRHGQKLSVDVNFGGDLGGEVDVAATNSNTNVMNTTSPASLTRPKHGSLQQNTVLHNPRASAVAVGYGQASTPSSTRSLPPASASPFSPTVNQSHAASSTPMSVTGTSFAASTPSPASGGVSSVFRDSRLASSL